MTNAYMGFLFVVAIIFLVFATIWLTLSYTRRRATFAPLTEPRLRLPGHELRAKYFKKHETINDLFILIVTASSAAMFSIIFDTPTLAKGVAIVVACGVAVWACFRLRTLFTDSKNLLLGLECEEYVGQELNLLMRHGAYVFHDVPCGNGNIDHVVIGHGQALAVETKGRRKPRKGDSGRARESEVTLTGDSLIFPKYEDTKSVPQVRTNARILSKSIQKHCEVEFNVIPVVAIPGWKINYPKYEPGNVLVVSPKRDNALKKWLGNEKNEQQTQVVAEYLDSIVRSVAQKSDITDPDARDHYDFWFNPKPKQKKLD